jgi:GntR family transcriptional regulator
MSDAMLIATLTVKKAYDELERDGVIYTARGNGTFVSEAPPRLSRAEKTDRLRELSRRLLSEAHLIGVELAQLIALIESEESRLRAERSRKAKERP